MTQPGNIRIGIDLGGTKIEGVTLEPNGTVKQRRRVDTPQNDYAAILQTIKSLINELTEDPSLPVGIGTPGSISRISPLMRNSNSTCLNGKPLLEDLNSFLKRDVRIANDADCFTLSEAVDGAGRDDAVVFGVILGTGVGGGISINRQLLSGVNGIAGEWGHNPIPLRQIELSQIELNQMEVRNCYCGKTNCIETWLSGPGLQRSFEQATNRVLPAESIVQESLKGNSAASDVLNEYCEKLAAALALVINIVDPDIIVLGGGLSNIDLIYEEVPKRLPNYVFSDHVATRLARAEHGDSSGVRGAAWLWD